MLVQCRKNQSILLCMDIKTDIKAENRADPAVVENALG